MRLPDCSECQTRLLINIVTLCNTQTNTQKDTRITRRVVLYSQTNTLSKSLAYGRYAHIVITSRRVVRIERRAPAHNRRSCAIPRLHLPWRARPQLPLS